MKEERRFNARVAMILIVIAFGLSLLWVRAIHASEPGEWVCMAAASRSCDAIGSDFNKKEAQDSARIFCEAKCNKKCKEMICIRMVKKR